jgi:hypothetical protein
MYLLPIAYVLVGVLFALARLLITRPTHGAYDLWSVHGDYQGQATGWHFPGILDDEEVGVLFPTIGAIVFWPFLVLVIVVLKCLVPMMGGAEWLIGRLFGR